MTVVNKDVNECKNLCRVWQVSPYIPSLYFMEKGPFLLRILPNGVLLRSGGVRSESEILHAKNKIDFLGWTGKFKSMKTKRRKNEF